VGRINNQKCHCKERWENYNLGGYDQDKMEDMLRRVATKGSPQEETHSTAKKTYMRLRRE